MQSTLAIARLNQHSYVVFLEKNKNKPVDKGKKYGILTNIAILHKPKKTDTDDQSG
jgi:hypothetical protein